MQAQTELAARVSTLVGGFLARKGALTEVDPRQDLLTAGLSSLDLVNLMLAVEGEFDVLLEEEQMTPANFRSVSSIQALVTSLT